MVSQKIGKFNDLIDHELGAIAVAGVAPALSSFWEHAL
jgi:hypothetical protein